VGLDSADASMTVGIRVRYDDVGEGVVEESAVAEVVAEAAPGTVIVTPAEAQSWAAIVRVSVGALVGDRMVKGFGEVGGVGMG